MDLKDAQLSVLKHQRDMANDNIVTLGAQLSLEQQITAELRKQIAEMKPRKGRPKKNGAVTKLPTVENASEKMTQ